MTPFDMPRNQRTALVGPFGDMSRNEHVDADIELTNEKAAPRLTYHIM